MSTPGERWDHEAQVLSWMMTNHSALISNALHGIKETHPKPWQIEALLDALDAATEARRAYEGEETR